MRLSHYLLCGRSSSLQALFAGGHPHKRLSKLKMHPKKEIATTSLRWEAEWNIDFQADMKGWQVYIYIPWLRISSYACPETCSLLRSDNRMCIRDLGLALMASHSPVNVPQKYC